MRVTFCRRARTGDALVRPGGAVVRLVLGQDGAQVCLAEDQHMVQHLAAQGAGEAFADPVHPRHLDCAARHPVPAASNTASKERVKFDPRSRIRNRMSPEPLAGAEGEVAGLVHRPFAGRAGGDATQVESIGRRAPVKADPVS